MLYVRYSFWVYTLLLGFCNFPIKSIYTQPISLAGFYDGIHHYQNKNGRNYARLDSTDFIRIADNVLLYQKDNGGWVENQDPLRILSDSQKDSVRVLKAKPQASFDNRNIYSQVEFLAEVYDTTKEPRFREACLKGLDFILEHQNAVCGGWPHTVYAESPQSYHPYITIADEVTSGNLRTLRKIWRERKRFNFIDAPRMAAIENAIARGDSCLIRLQIRQNGQLTGWAGQYNHITLVPAQGRAYELPSIVSQETVEVLRYLMEIENPSPEVVNSITQAVSWLERSALSGLRIETVDAEPVQYKYHSSKHDRRLIKDASAPPLWARFYDLNDNSVVLAHPDGHRVADYSDIPRERRTGYDWYGTWPALILENEYPAWLQGK